MPQPGTPQTRLRRCSPKRERRTLRHAAVLAYINSLLLCTLPQIDADNAAGITDPTKPPAKTLPIPVPDAAPAADPANTWDPSIPEPDPKKKPS